MKLQEILEIKATIIEVGKDSPLIAYMAFYEPLHSWMSGVAAGWDTSAKFILNVVMAIYGLLRIIDIIRKWKDDPKDGDDDNEGGDIK
jgi:hypothetical protein